jgi:hypothetical protein
VSKTEQLFEAEATLRYRAQQFAGTVVEKPDTNTCRRNLRAAALEYARLAREIDDCFDDGATP